jgi:hypothetical protein
MLAREGRIDVARHSNVGLFDRAELAFKRVILLGALFGLLLFMNVLVGGTGLLVWYFVLVPLAGVRPIEEHWVGTAVAATVFLTLLAVADIDRQEESEREEMRARTEDQDWERHFETIFRIPIEDPDFVMKVRAWLPEVTEKNIVDYRKMKRSIGDKEAHLRGLLSLLASPSARPTSDLKDYRLYVGTS